MPFLDKNTHGFLLKTKPGEQSLLPRNKALREKSRLLRPGVCGLLCRPRSHLDKGDKVPPGLQGEDKGENGLQVFIAVPARAATPLRSTLLSSVAPSEG